MNIDRNISFQGTYGIKPKSVIGFFQKNEERIQSLAFTGAQWTLENRKEAKEISSGVAMTVTQSLRRLDRRG